MRIKSRWHRKDKPKSVEEIAGALAFIAWRIGFNAVKEMQEKDFRFGSDATRLEIIGEFLAFLIQVADRLAYDKGMEEDERRRFVTTLALRLADTMQDNKQDVLGPGDYRPPFIEKLNRRLDDYSEFSFVDGRPGHQFCGYLGRMVDETIGGPENKWVVEQVADVESLEASDTLKKGFDNLFG